MKILALVLCLLSETAALAEDFYFQTQDAAAAWRNSTKIPGGSLPTTPALSGSTTATLITSATTVTLSGTSYLKAVVQVTGTSTAYLALGSVTASATNALILNAAAAVDTGGDSRTIDDFQGPISLGFAGGTGKVILTRFYK